MATRSGPTLSKPRQLQRPIVDRLRRSCLAFPGTTETSAWGHPNFRAGRRTFATFEIVNERPSIALRVSPADLELLLAQPTFFATPYGRGQWVSVWVDGSVDWKQLERLLDRSYRLVANKRMLATLDGLDS